MHDKFKKRNRVAKVDSRLRRQIAQESAKRLFLHRRSDENRPNPSDTLWLDALAPAEYLAAKRKAVAVLGQRVRPSDLPTDIEVREQVLSLIKAGHPGLAEADEPQESEIGSVGRLGDHIDRFTLYKMRLEPLETVKQNPKLHPEGDALYHSLQVFDLARRTHPYDEEFLLAALLHDVGKAIDPQDHVQAGVEALRGAVTERTLWLVEHHMDLCENPKYKRAVQTDSAELKEDLRVLRQLDDAGRVPGVPVSSIEEALGYLRALETEDFLEAREEEDDQRSPAGPVG